MTALFPQNTPASAGAPQGIRELFDKGKWWRQRDGAWVKVKHMSPGHRANVAAMLMRDARAYAFRYVLAGDRYLHDMSPAHRANVARMLMRDARAYAFRYVLAGDRYLHDAPDEVWAEYENESDRIMADPKMWMRGTKLYRRLTEHARIDARVDDNDPQFVNGVEYHANAFGPECTCKQASDMGHDVECPRADWARGNR